MMEGEKVIEPLLYINQPNLNKPKAYMQDHYKSEKKMDTEKIDVEHSIVESDQQQSFEKLTIPAKIEYLVNLPSELPSIKCEIITDEKTYRGILIDEQNEVVVLRMLGRENKKIEKKQILKISLIGF